MSGFLRVYIFDKSNNYLTDLHEKFREAFSLKPSNEAENIFYCTQIAFLESNGILEDILNATKLGILPQKKIFSECREIGNIVTANFSIKQLGGCEFRLYLNQCYSCSTFVLYCERIITSAYLELFITYFKHVYYNIEPLHSEKSYYFSIEKLGTGGDFIPIEFSNLNGYNMAKENFGVVRRSYPSPSEPNDAESLEEIEIYKGAQSKEKFAKRFFSLTVKAIKDNTFEGDVEFQEDNIKPPFKLRRSERLANKKKTKK